MVNGQELESETGKYYWHVNIIKNANVTLLSYIATAWLVANAVLCFLASDTVTCLSRKTSKITC